jgi:starch-binding outer membrane protein SusE/F
MTYSLTLTTWGIIGDATAGGWGTQTDMTYNSSSQTFSLAAHLTTGAAFKFRGTSDWGINYGSTAADGKTLNAGGDNIPVTLTADYAITLDLSHPNAYTYSANRWGLIGSSTADGWNSDQNLTWDAVNKVFKITADLVVGEIKFRANDAWDLALGGTVDALSTSGGNIAVATAGNYTITLDPWALKATITKN